MKLDGRRKYYMVLDCETATLPYVTELEPEQKKTVAIAKPLIYDLGWQIIDRKGRVYDRKNFLISEIFQYPQFLILHTMQAKDLFILRCLIRAKLF